MNRILSGMRPTGPLHLGHLLGALENWRKLQAGHECFFMVADLHALMGEYENPAHIRAYSIQMVKDWLACGVDPKQSTIFIQSEIPEHSALALILGMLTPLGWLERNPTYKEQLREIQGRDLTTYGFLGYPVLQAADILLYKANRVPVGEDQLAHLELTREIARRFNHFYKKDIFPEPEALLSKGARLLGTDRRKMSKSYDNAINLSDPPDTVHKKVLSMITDPQRIKTQDPGHPEVCNVYSYYNIFCDRSRYPDADGGKVSAVYQWCTGAKKGCVDCKKELAEILIDQLKSLKREPPKSDSEVGKVLAMGRARAGKVA
ncbi:MAG: tryptophan--tRNA ligase, partial [Candidatus Omnitrophica bacterium CG07_land_8_20_14_0_80_50_8]